MNTSSYLAGKIMVFTTALKKLSVKVKVSSTTPGLQEGMKKSGPGCSQAEKLLMKRK